ncbi:WYL domain-containing protein [Nocardioides sp. NPDC004968]|uniref:helix-turn-helix transcriptional regulator n=1 Tax=Nocardioides sp. NPDC004968 TaxID=3155894 RepID=UPI0033A7A29C
MRADRLVSLVLLLRQRGRLTADVLARELEVSTRTVLRDIEALSAAGVPVYAERGRYGGFSLLPGFRTELTGLNHDEALALLTAGSGRGERIFGLGSALASAMRKVVDALPESHQTAASDAAQRFLFDPETDLLSRRLDVDEVSKEAMAEIRQAVLVGHKLRLHYASRGQAPRGCIVDPIGLVTVREKGYLLATESGIDRTFRMSRVVEAYELPERAQRADDVDLERMWAERCAQFLSEGHIAVQVRVDPARRDQLLDMAEAVRAEEPDPDGWLRLEVTFQDLWHAEWAMWQLGTNVESLGPQELRVALYQRAQTVADRYRDRP